MSQEFDCVIMGAGFTGLAAALRLSEHGYSVAVVESERLPGGLAGVFDFSEDVSLEKFYHHFFLSDSYILELIKDLGLEDSLKFVPSRTGTYFNGQLWRLSSPLDLLRFKALSLLDRFRLGIAVIKARLIRDHREIEHLSIREWLEPQVGRRTFEIVWQPLLDSKFGEFADDVSAAWMWKKLVLRGGSRAASGGERLAYLEGGYSKLISRVVEKLERRGVSLLFDFHVDQLVPNQETIAAIESRDGETLQGKVFLSTLPNPETFRLLESTGKPSRHPNLIDVPHLANVCLVLALNKSLSDTYWINVNDPGFPFVGVIEHTNLDESDSFHGLHVVYLSRYLTVADPMWNMADDDLLDYCLPFLTQMFPRFSREWVVEYRAWRAKYAQPVTTRNYSQQVPPNQSAFANLLIENMAQIYPEDRGVNYAIRGGHRAAEVIQNLLADSRRTSDKPKEGV